MENLDNETIIKNINEFKLLLTTQRQYVLNTQHDNTIKNDEIKIKDDEIKKLQKNINKNYLKKKLYKNENIFLKNEILNLKNQVDFLKNMLLFNNSYNNKPLLNQTLNCNELPKMVEPEIKESLKLIEEIKPKSNEKKVDANKIKMGDVLSELKNRFNKSD
jgi:hypothetical protein